MSVIGTKVKPFKAQAFKNGDFLEVSEENFKGQWTVLCFYPADFTFVCPTELEDLENEYSNLKELGADVYSCSTDTHFTHKAWHETSEAIGKVTYTMIGDPSLTLPSHFEVLRVEQGLADRGTFIIDPDGVIQVAEVHAEGIGRDASGLIDKLKAAQYVYKNPGEVCPAKWKEGSETLKPSIDLVGKI
ncbi:alkyl hydroperoxide reductase subunit C [Bacillus sp. AK128]